MKSGSLELGKEGNNKESLNSGIQSKAQGNQLSQFVRILLALALKVLCVRKPLCPGETTRVGHPSMWGTL